MKTIPENLVTIAGNLRDAYKQVIPGTMRHVDELINDREIAWKSWKLNWELKNKWPRDKDLIFECRRTLWNNFYAADGNVFYMHGDHAYWAITRESNNLILQNIDDAYSELAATGNYRTSLIQTAKVLTDPSTVHINLSMLRLSPRYHQTFNREFGDLDIKATTDDFSVCVGATYFFKKASGGMEKTSTSNYGEINEEEQKVIARLGYSTEYLTIYGNRSRGFTTIQVPHPHYISGQIKNHQTKHFLWRASILNSMSDPMNSDFIADASVNKDYCNLRAVRKNFCQLKRGKSEEIN